MGKTKSAFLRYWPFLLIFAAAVVVRSLPLGYVFDGGRVWFFEGDCYMHLRKIFLHIRNFPHFVTFDYFEGYPEGTRAISPPLIDYLLSFFSVLIGLGRPAKWLVESLAAVVPPLMGGLSVLAAYALARSIFNREVAAISSLILVFMPAHVEFTLLGRFDNEMMEPLVAALLFLGYVKVQKSAGFMDSMRGALFLGAVSFFSLFFWRGAPLWIMFLALASILDITLDFLGEDASQAIGRHISMGLAFLLPALVLVPFSHLGLWGARDSFAFNVVSWFHVYIFSAFSMLVFTYGAASSYCKKRGCPRGKFLFAAFVSIGLLALALTAYRPLRENLSAALGVLGIGAKDPWLQSVSEYQPLLSDLGPGLALPVQYFGWMFWLLPAVLVWLLLDLRKGGLDRGKAFFVLTTVCLIAVTLLRRRFMHVLALNTAISGGWMLYAVYSHAVRGGVARVGKQAALTLTAALSLLLFYPFAVSAYRLPSMQVGAAVKGDVSETMDWLRENTPSPGDAYDPLEKPPYSVMAPWGLAGWLEYLAERPVVATLYGSEAFGLRETGMFYLAESEEEAVEAMRRTGARYVVLTEMMGGLDMLAKTLGLDGGEYVASFSQPGLMKKAYAPGRRYFDLVSTRLYLADGIDMDTAVVSLDGVEHFRLAFESSTKTLIPAFDVEASRYKVFEHVKGASLRVSTSPGEEVAVSATVLTNKGRAFDLREVAYADSKGMADFVLIYAGRRGDGGTGIDGPYMVRAGRSSAKILLPDKDVLAGSEIGIRLLP
jgi:asparagine N-glycosylation enzyme membrane subunit Stt3